MKNATQYEAKWSHPDYFTKITFNPRGLLDGQVNAFWGVPARATHIPGIYAMFLDCFIQYLDAKAADRSFEHYERLLSAGWRPQDGSKRVLKLRRGFLEELLFRVSRTINHVVVSQLAKTIRESEGEYRILDLGCGISVLYDLLQLFEVSYYGIDASSSILKYSYAPEHCLKTMELREFLTAPSFDGPFDCIVDSLCSKDFYIYPKTAAARNITEASDYSGMLAAIDSLLKPGGIFVHVQPVREYERRKTRIKPFEHYLPQHWRSWEAKGESVENYTIYWLLAHEQR